MSVGANQSLKTNLDPETRRTERLVGLALAGTFGVLLLALIIAGLKLRSASAKPLPVYGAVGDFALTNQAGQPITLADL